GGISGSDLAQRAFAQARRFNAEILSAVEATGIRLEEPTRVLILGDGTELRARSLLIATGMTIKTIDAPGFEKLRGAGVYYGATRSEATNFKGENVLVVGGANSAGQAAIMLAQYAANVTIVVRATSLSEKMSAYLIDQIDATANIEVLTA